ncbi:hypothetical protein MMPV_001749 [Pyropia vietnamensis]
MLATASIIASALPAALGRRATAAVATAVASSDRWAASLSLSTLSPSGRVPTEVPLPTGVPPSVASDAPWLSDHRRAPQGSPLRSPPVTHNPDDDGGDAAAIAAAPSTAPVPPLSVTQRRILYRASQRGWLELDVLLGKWAASAVPAMPPAALAETEVLLSHETPELYRWVAGQDRPPPEVIARCGRVLASIRAFVEGGGGAPGTPHKPPAH